MVLQQVVCPVFIGRLDELAALHVARRALAQSQGSVVLVGGEAGIGKTRLLGQFVSLVERDQRRRNLAGAECPEFAEQPYGAFRDLYATLGGSFPASAERPLDKRQIFDRVVEDLRGLATQRATILTIEDLHWADRSSLELLAYLAPRVRGTRLLVIATYRTEEVALRDSLAIALARLAREPSVSRIVLEPLDIAQTRDLLHSASSGRTACPPHLIERVARRSEGNPFFAEELLKDALDARADRDPQVPFSIRASVTERLASLEPEEQRVLAHASVLGYRFDPHLLALTMAVSVDHVLPALHRARDLNVLIEEPTGRDTFRFRHALTREVVYEATLRFDARRTHERILATLESLPDAGRHLEALAYHAAAAHDRTRAAHYNRLAGDAALAVHSLDEATLFYERALQNIEPGGLAEAAALEALANVLDLRGNLPAAVDPFERAHARYLASGDFDGAARTMRRLCITRSNLGDMGATALGRTFLRAYGSRIGDPVRGALIAALARLAAIIYDLAAVRELLAELPDCGTLEPRARQNELNAAMDLHFFDGDAERWQALVPDVLEILDRVPQQLAMTCLIALAQSASKFGFVAIADDAFARVDRIERRFEFEAIAAHGEAVRLMHELTYGRIAPLRQDLAHASRAPGAAVSVMALATVVPHAAALFGEPALVTPEIEACFAASRNDRGSLDDAEILAAAAAWEISRGNLARARADLRLACEIAARATPGSADLLSLAARHLAADEIAPVRRLIAGPFHGSDRSGPAGARLAEAILERRFGDSARAATLASEAAVAFHALRWPLFEARAHEERGDVAAAEAIWKSLGLARERERPATSAASLTRREYDVAREIARGATNAQIAERLSIGLSTVEKHITSIFEKLDVKRRSQIAATFATQDHATSEGSPRP